MVPSAEVATTSTVGCFPSSRRVRYQSTTLPSASGQQAHASPLGERRAVPFTLAAGGNQKPLAVKASVPPALEALVANDFERPRVDLDKVTVEKAVQIGVDPFWWTVSLRSSLVDGM
jgi:hypothetical protein